MPDRWGTVKGSANDVERKLYESISELEVDMEELRYEISDDLSSTKLTAEKAMIKSSEAIMAVKELRAELDTIIELIKPRKNKRRRMVVLLRLLLLAFSATAAVLSHQWLIAALCIMCLALQTSQPKRLPTRMGSWSSMKADEPKNGRGGLSNPGR